MLPRLPLPFVGAAALALSASARVSTSDGGTTAAAVQVIRALRETRVHRERPADETVRTLVDAGAAAIEPMLAILVEREIAPLEPEEDWQVLSQPQRSLIVGALARLPAEIAVLGIEARLADGATAEERWAALYVYSAVGRSRDLRHVLDLATAYEPPPLSESFDEAVRAAFTGVLQREASAFETLYGLVRDAREDVRPAVLFAAAATGDCRASALFSRVLSVDPTLADVALAQARLLRRSPSLDANRDLANAARRYLYDAESRRRSAAARTLGELRDPASVPALCELLESGSRDLEESALWALRRISGLSLPPTRTAWTGWYERALASWERLRQRAPMRLADPRLAERHAIVSDLSSEQLFRDEAAMLLALATTDMDDRVCVAACRGLAQLDSPCAYASLIAARDRANERVAAAASEALQQIARRPLPTGADACRAALGI